MKAFCANCHKSVEAIHDYAAIGNGVFENIYYCPHCGYEKGSFSICEHCHTLISSSEFEIVNDFDGTQIGDFCPSCGRFSDSYTPEA